MDSGVSAGGGVRLGISTCLLGEPVRWDGGRKRDPFLLETMGRFVSWVPVCPEMEAGFGVPRPPLHLEGEARSPRLRENGTGADHTERMLRWAGERLELLAKARLDGFVFKSRSPSCGLGKVPVTTPRGTGRNGTGIFAGIFLDRFPLIPAEEEVSLHDPDRREVFIGKVFTLRRYREAVSGVRKVGGLVAFHARHELTLMAQSPRHLAQMAPLVARARELPREELFPLYERMLLEALSFHATRPKHAAVLTRVRGYLRTLLTPGERADLDRMVESYRKGLVPLLVPVTLANHFIRKYGERRLAEQAYLDPSPEEMFLLYHP